jgi:hypothetical protein
MLSSLRARRPLSVRTTLRTEMRGLIFLMIMLVLVHIDGVKMVWQEYQTITSACASHYLFGMVKITFLRSVCLELLVIKEITAKM